MNTFQRYRDADVAAILNMRCSQGLPMRAIAERTGRTVEAVRSLVYRHGGALRSYTMPECEPDVEVSWTPRQYRRMNDNMLAALRREHGAA